VDRLDDSVGLGREEGIEIGLDLTLFELADTGPARPDAGKDEQRPVLAHRKPGVRCALAFLFACRVWLGELCYRHDAPVLDPKGRIRSDYYNKLTGQKNEHWLVAAMTNSEVPISLLAKGQRKAGEEIRYIDYSIPPKEDGGILDFWVDNPEGFEGDPKTIIQTATMAAEKNNGACLDAFLTHLTQDVAQSKRLANRYCNRFCNLIRKEPVYDTLQDRYIEAFGKVYAALRLAVRYEVVPFDAKHVRKSVMTVFAQSELVQGQDGFVATAMRPHSGRSWLLSMILEAAIRSYVSRDRLHDG